MSGGTEMFFMMLALPALFGLTLGGEGIYQMAHYDRGWFNVGLGGVFLVVVAFGYFFLRGVV